MIDSSWSKAEVLRVATRGWFFFLLLLQPLPSRGLFDGKVWGSGVSRIDRSGGTFEFYMLDQIFGTLLKGKHL